MTKDNDLMMSGEILREAYKRRWIEVLMERDKLAADYKKMLEAYATAHNQAMANGAELADTKARLTETELELGRYQRLSSIPMIRRAEEAEARLAEVAAALIASDSAELVKPSVSGAGTACRCQHPHASTADITFRDPHCPVHGRASECAQCGGRGYAIVGHHDRPDTHTPCPACAPKRTGRVKLRR